MQTLQTLLKDVYTPEEFRTEVMREMGRVGGSRTSPAKVAAGRRNAARATWQHRLNSAARRLENCNIADHDAEAKRYEAIYAGYIKAMRN